MVVQALISKNFCLIPFNVFCFKSKLKCSLENLKDEKMGAMKRGRGTCGTFKAFNLTYLHAERVETNFGCPK